VRRVSAPTDRVAVIGAGASTLVIELVAHGYRSIEAVDIAAPALDRLRQRLGADTGALSTTCADVRQLSFDEPVAVWHDRATFHFLTDPDDQAAYARRAEAAVAPGGWLVMAAFAPAGPDRCSGLPVAGHSASSLAAALPGFDMTESFERAHLTPWGTPQLFTHALMRRRPAR
jgi:hypothetical protein